MLLDILYYIFIFPFEELFYAVLGFFLQIFPAGVSIIFLSIVINMIYIPIYMLAKKVEKKERIKQDIVKEKVKAIKKEYKGEAAFRKIEQVYKEHNYSIFLSFRVNLSFFIMLPFFVAAVKTLNVNEAFLSEPFLMISNLGEPDHLLPFGLNFLPILMTIFNILAIKFMGQNDGNKKPLFHKSNIKLIILAVAFLFYLYNKNASLLLYWTFNNLISFGRTFFEYIYYRKKRVEG